jgi:hypothetical protein
VCPTAVFEDGGSSSAASPPVPVAAYGMVFPATLGGGRRCRFRGIRYSGLLPSSPLWSATGVGPWVCIISLRLVCFQAERMPLTHETPLGKRRARRLQNRMVPVISRGVRSPNLCVIVGVIMHVWCDVCTRMNGYYSLRPKIITLVDFCDSRLTIRLI